jgi:hypothetical protein
MDLNINIFSIENNNNNINNNNNNLNNIYINNNNHIHEHGRNFNRRFSRSPTKKVTIKDQVQNLHITADELLRHLNIFLYFFSFELVI